MVLWDLTKARITVMAKAWDLNWCVVVIVVVVVVLVLVVLVLVVVSLSTWLALLSPTWKFLNV